MKSIENTPRLKIPSPSPGSVAGNLFTYSAEIVSAAADYTESLTTANIELLRRSAAAAGQLAASLASDVFHPGADANTFEVKASILPTPTHLRVGNFIQRTDTPGNVGVCLSGGGSRSMLSSMGELRALKALGLLSKVKALSTVSGGSWAAMVFTYLPDVIPDDNFLNGFVEDPSQLTLSLGRQGNMAAALDYLPPGNLATAAASHNMSISAWAVQAWYLFSQGVPPRNLWTRLIGDNILAPFGLSEFGSGNLPRGFFTYDEQTMQAILASNPNLGQTAYLYRRPRSSADAVRPFHICNTSMFITPDKSSGDVPPGMQLLAPVQSTAFFTGILPSGLGTGAAGVPVGGGGVTSLAFGGKLVDKPSPDGVVIRTGSLFAPAEITGMSSAFFASLVAQSLPALGSMDPGHLYWPIVNAAVGQGTLNRFADGGDLEDNGVASMLTYEDIDRLVVFVNSTPLGKDRFGNIKIDMWLPSLFGFTPYHEGLTAAESGYKSYRGAGGKPTPGIAASDLYFQYNQVFPSDQFQPLLDALWQASGAGSNENPAVVHTPEIQVLPNNWFGVKGGRTVEILWVILNPVESWIRRLRPDVQAALPRDFPNYNILRIHQSAAEANLLASLTAWTVYQQKEILIRFFQN